MEMEAEEGRKCQSHLAKFVYDKVSLAANKAAIAEAKLKAIEQATEDEEDEKNHVSHYSRFHRPHRH